MTFLYCHLVTVSHFIPLPGTGEYCIAESGFVGMMVEFYCGVCPGYCLDVFTHFSQYYNSSQFTVVQYTLHSSVVFVVAALH